jgi:hypothetical protein
MKETKTAEELEPDTELTVSLNYKMYWENVGHVQRMTMPEKYRHSRWGISTLLLQEFAAGTQRLIICRAYLMERSYFKVNFQMAFRDKTVLSISPNESPYMAWDFHWGKFFYANNGPAPRPQPGIVFNGWGTNVMPVEHVVDYARILAEVYNFGRRYFDRDGV